VSDPDQSPDVDINTPSSAPVQPAMPERQPDNITFPAVAHSATDSVPTSTRQRDRAVTHKGRQCGSSTRYCIAAVMVLITGLFIGQG
jgi:hypothetical protein